MKENKLEKLFTEQVTCQKENYYRLVYSYTKNAEDTLDIIQESICKGFSSLVTIKDPGGMKTWFYRILVNTSLDFLRKQKKVTAMDEELLNVKTSAVDSYSDIDLSNALDNLPTIYREIIILRYFEDLKIEEIAAILEVNPNTVKTRLYAGLKILRLDLAE